MKLQILSGFSLNALSVIFKAYISMKMHVKHLCDPYETSDSAKLSVKDLCNPQKLKKSTRVVQRRLCHTPLKRKFFSTLCNFCETRTKH